MEPLSKTHSSIAAANPRRLAGLAREYYELTKPRVVSLIIFTAVVGMFLSTPGALPLSALLLGTLGIALAVVLLAFLMMITRSKAIPQVIGFLAMENGLFFAATSATYGMPMVVELGIALDVLVGVIILGVFFFQIRDQFDSLDIHHMERLKDN